MIDRKRAHYLLERYHQTLLTPEEHIEFLVLLHDPRLELLRREWLDGKWPDKDGNLESPIHAKETLRMILDSKRHSRYLLWIRYAVVAASIIAIISTGLLLVKNRVSEKHVNQIASDVAPGGNKAMLTLADGRMISLSEAQDGLVVNEQIRYADGSMVDGIASSESIQELILSVPRGGVYQIQLADGTKVWLNSDSKLYYPSRFAGESRTVSLEGEGYFEVAKSSIPFYVKSKSQTVQVLGTKFNIAAYSNEESIRTTLVEGRVKIGSPEESKVLHVGDQALLAGDHLSIRKVDVQKYVAWKDGYFDFTDMSLREVLTQLGRWYDLEVVFEGRVPQIEFYGTIDRDNRLSTVMTLLETNNLKYRLEAHKLIVSNKN